MNQRSVPEIFSEWLKEGWASKLSVGIFILLVIINLIPNGALSGYEVSIWVVYLICTILAVAILISIIQWFTLFVEICHSKPNVGWFLGGVFIGFLIAAILFEK